MGRGLRRCTSLDFVSSRLWHSACVAALICLLFSTSGHGYWYDPALAEWNLNENQYALSANDYWGERSGHNYTTSPQNWRFPFYTIMPDRFVNGNPNNDDINGTYFEYDRRSNQMRHGGDIVGLIDSLDYLRGMGIKGLYIAGSAFMNLPWTYDGYSPLDLTLLDPHFGTLQEWRTVIDEIHARGMYIVLDNTFATLSDLLGFEGYLNTTTPFSVDEHPALYKTSRQYYDFTFGNAYNETCSYPRFWNETGYPVDAYVISALQGCYDSDFDQYGDTEAFGVYPDWRRQLTNFASVQDRLREWHPPVRTKLERFYCLTIAQLDIDGFRYDKAVQSTVDAMGSMNAAMRQCARDFNKTNFFLPGEITGGNSLGSVYLGRGRQPDMLPESVLDAVPTANQSNFDGYSIRAPDWLSFGNLHVCAQLWRRRRITGASLGLPGLRHPRHAANMGRFALVLGIPCQQDLDGRLSKLGTVPRQFARNDWHSSANRTTYLGSRSPPMVPGKVPDLYKSLWRRRIIIWFFISVLIQNFFLSTQHGRSWSFLFTTDHLTWWQIYLLVIFFFIIVWAFAMWGFSVLTHSHTWILPIFAIGLGAPRWAQIWWGTSGMGNWLPWAPGGYIGSALVSRGIWLWLWLGVLDAIQGVGVGMVLLSTLTRVHVLFTLLVAQVLGAATTAVARACAPHKLGPTPVFPDITSGIGSIANAWFWIGLLLNLGVMIGYFKFFRKEQLTKP